MVGPPPLAGVDSGSLKALASSTLAGSLTGTSVALVVLPGASDDDVSAIRSTLTDAGASVVGRVTLTDNWQSTSMSQYRTTLATTLASHLESGAAKTAIDEDPAGKATTVVAVGARAQAATSTQASVAASSDAWIGLGLAVGSTSGVVVGDASSREAMISQIRTSGTAVTTVDSVGTTLASVDTALALSTASNGARAYGVGNGAQSVIPSIK